MSSASAKVINIKSRENSGKKAGFCNLSTLSTLKHVILVDYSGKTKERMFCKEITKFAFCRKKWKCILHFESSIFRKKKLLNVYTMEKNGYNIDYQSTKEAIIWHRLIRIPQLANY